MHDKKKKKLKSNFLGNSIGNFTNKLKKCFKYRAGNPHLLKYGTEKSKDFSLTEKVLSQKKKTHPS